MKILKDYKIQLSPKKSDNYINLKGRDYQLKYLSDNIESNKGGNSNLFLLYDSQNNNSDFIIKLCKANLHDKKGRTSKRARRFWREIYALKKAKDANLNKVIDIYFYGVNEFVDTKSKTKYKFAYFVAERGEHNLADFILAGNLINNLSSKVQICIDLIESLKQLHELGIYHRDIKPENILFFKDGTWKICDLGLISCRNNDFTIDYPNEMIGPRGWLCPEAANKFYTFDRTTEFNFDCLIDDLSDIFQLGKVFWFIFQSNIPIGRVKRDDFKIADDTLYSFLIWMLNYKKEKRPNINLLHTEFKRVFSRKYV